MRTINKCFLSVAILFTMLSIIGCKKDNDNDDPNNPPAGDCMLVTYRCESRNETWRIVYNSSGSFDSILIGDQLNVDEERRFTYDPAQKKIIVNRYFQGTLDEVNHVELFADGKIKSIRDVSPVSSSWEQESFSYRTDIPQLVDKSAGTVSGSGVSSETSYQWEMNNSGGGLNMVKHVTPSGVFTYEYFFDKPTQAGDYLNFEKVISTYDKYYKPFSSTNLLKSIKMDGDPLVDVTYTFDNNGKITRFAVSYDGSSQPEIWDLSYECK